MKPKRIVVRMPNWLGDVVMATPALLDLREAFPEAHIVALGLASCGELLKKEHAVDELLSFTRGRNLFEQLENRALIKKLRAGEFDLGVLLTNSLSSAWWFRRGHVRRRVGFAMGARSGLLTDAVARPPEVRSQHLTTTYKLLLEPLGIEVSETLPRLIVGQAERQAARRLLEREGAEAGMRIVGINPGAQYGLAKCWLPERFREVARRLAEDKQVRVVFFGDPASAERVCEMAGGLGEGGINLAGKTSVRELAALLAVCDVVLTNDSGPMHIADAVGTPVVALFGSTSAIETGPSHGGRVLQKRVACSPCFKRECPIDFRCMKQIEVSEVVEAVQEELARVKSYV